MNDQDIKDQVFLDWIEFGNGLGNERRCFQNPDDKNKCIKVSHKVRSKQTQRELGYFKLLIKRGVPFIHLPNFYGMIDSKDYIGLIQEIIVDSSGDISQNLIDFILCDSFDKDKKNKILYILDELKLYLLKYNIIPCDLMMTNILIKKSEYGCKAILIDGLGSSKFVSLDNHIPFLGRITIKRKWDRFLYKELMPRLNKI